MIRACRQRGVGKSAFYVDRLLQENLEAEVWELQLLLGKQGCARFAYFSGCVAPVDIVYWTIAIITLETDPQGGRWKTRKLVFGLETPLNSVLVCVPEWCLYDMLAAFACESGILEF